MKPLALWALVGAGFGALVSVVNNLGYDVSANRTVPPLEVLSYLIGIGWPWATLAVLAGWHARRSGSRRPLAVLAATAALAAAVVSYYAADIAFGVYGPDGGWGDARHDVTFWLVGAAITAPPMGLVGAHIGPGPIGRLAAVIVPLMALVDTSMRFSSFDKPGRTATNVVVTVLAVAVGIVILTRPRLLARVAADPAQRHTAQGVSLTR